MRGLALIAISEIQGVIGTDLQIKSLIVISVVVTKPHREGPIRISLPAIKGGTYILSAGILDSGEWVLPGIQTEEACGEQKRGRTNGGPPSKLTQTSGRHYR